MSNNNENKKTISDIDLELAKRFFNYVETDVLAGAMFYRGETIYHNSDEEVVVVEKDSRLSRSIIATAISSGFNMPISTARLDTAIDYHSAKNTRYKHAEYLQNLTAKPCDVMELYKALGIEGDSASQLYLDTWLTGAVARAINPGCKFDLMLILTGKQGCGKTTFLQNLCPDKSWFLSDNGTGTDQNNYMKRSRSWIVECGEVSHTFGAKARDLLKQDISAQRDIYRPPYGREIVDSPRHYVMAGTTNDLSFLNDPTGNRRFAVIKIGVDIIDNTWVENNLDSIWAYYYNRFLNGGAYHLTKEQEQLLSTTNQRFTYEDPFRQQIMDIVENLNEITHQELKQQLGLEHVHQNNKDLKTAVRHIQELGFASVKNEKGRFFRRIEPITLSPKLSQKTDLPEAATDKEVLSSLGKTGL